MRGLTYAMVLNFYQKSKIFLLKDSGFLYVFHNIMTLFTVDRGCRKPVLHAVDPRNKGERKEKKKELFFLIIAGMEVCGLSDGFGQGNECMSTPPRDQWILFREVIILYANESSSRGSQHVTRWKHMTRVIC